MLFPSLVRNAGLSRGILVPALVAAIATAVVAGLANAWNLPLALTLEDSLWRFNRGRTKTMTGLLLVQTTMSVLLLAGAGMFGASFYKLASQDLGLRMNDVVLVEAEPGPDAPSGEVYESALERVRAVADVELATVIGSLPFSGFNVPPISVPGRVSPPSVGQQLPFLIASTPELLKILDIRIVEGRGFTQADDRGALVVIVNQTMAREIWPGESAVGKCIRIGFDPGFKPGGGPPTLPPPFRVAK